MIKGEVLNTSRAGDNKCSDDNGRDHKGVATTRVSERRG